MDNLDLDTRLLSEFLYALNIARRQVATYPPGHPMITAASEKLLALLEKLLEFRREVTLGIARDSLLLDGKQLDLANPVYRDLAINLFNARVVSVTIQAGATADEARQFFEALSCPHEKIAAVGGLSAMLTALGVRGFRVQEIDYRAFHATEVAALNAPRTAVGNDDSAVLWKAFANGMVSGTIDPDGVLQLPQEQFDPVLLAEVLNRKQESVKGQVAETYDHAIANFIQQSNHRQLNVQSSQELFDRLGLMIERLSPELRRRFLNSTLHGLSAHPDQANRVLANWSQSTIVDALEQVEADQLQVPRILMDILGKLGGKPKAADSQRQVTAMSSRNKEQTAEQLKKLFRDGGIESYVPDDYADALAVLAAADVETSLDSPQVEGLLDTLNGHDLERQFCAILLDLMEQDIGVGSDELIARNLEEFAPYFLESGDFASLTGIHDHLSRLLDDPHMLSTAAVNRSRGIFASENFISLLLDGLDEWGKEQYPAIREMIGKIGLPFVAPLLDRLAEESVMSRRRLYMECIQQIGGRAFDSIVERLGDPRWYVVRNMVVLLRELNDPEALHPLNRLLGHAHPKVRYEVIRACLHFNDPRADRYLLRQLDQNEPGSLLGAVRLAASSRNPHVARRLAELLNVRGGSEPEMVLKRAIIATLMEMGCMEALPGLAVFIESRSLFMTRSLLRLKLEAVASLERYSGPEAVSLAARLQQKSTGEIALAAEKVARKLGGAPS